jgi:hypothetical protein
MLNAFMDTARIFICFGAEPLAFTNAIERIKAKLLINKQLLKTHDK